MPGKHNVLQYVETSGPGGAETVLLNIAKHLNRVRFEPSVVLHRSDWLHQSLKKEEIATEIIPSTHSWDIPFLMKFIGYCRRHKIDLIHSHLFGANLYSSLAGAILRIPVIATFHNELFFQGRLERFLKLKAMLIRKFAARMVFVANYMQDEYIRHLNFPANKISTVYNGVETGFKIKQDEISSLKKELDIGDDNLVAGHVANFRAPKGHRYLVESAAIVVKRIPNAIFLLIGDEGDGTIKKEIENSIIEFGLQGNFRLLGFRKDVEKLLQLIDVFVLSSTSEGLPLSVIEAMACSRPVVATNVGGLPEIIVPNSTGFLAEPRNSEALAEKLILLLENTALRAEMGNAGRKLVEDKYSMRTMIKNYQDLYEEMLK